MASAHGEKAADRRAHEVSDGPISGSLVRAKSTASPGNTRDDTPQLLHEPTSTGTTVTPAKTGPGHYRAAKQAKPPAVPTRTGG